MKLFTKYLLLLLTFIAVLQASIKPLTSSYDLRSSEYGASYYDPRTSVWQSPDPIIGEYMSGQTNGGVFNPKNLSLFTYTYNNPVNFVDPNGKEVYVDTIGTIIKNVKNDDKNVYLYSGKDISKDKDLGNSINNIGELGKEINIDKIYSNLLDKNVQEAKDTWNPFTFRDNVKGKSKWDYKNRKDTIYGYANDGKTTFSFNGENGISAPDLGNHHFGVVGKAVGLFPETFMLKQAGKAQIVSKTSNSEWQNYKMRRGVKTMTAPYGDDPRDQTFIKKGFHYYGNHYE